MLGKRNPDLLFAQAMNLNFKIANVSKNKLEEFNHSVLMLERSVLNL